MPREQARPYFAVFAMRRANWTEAIVSLNANEEGARAVAQRIVAAKSQKFVRCRVKVMHLTSSQVRAICHEWGRVDSLAGVLLRPTNFPKPYAAAYRRGYRAGLEQARRAGGEAGGTPR